jgi:hypothetical protein
MGIQLNHTVVHSKDKRAAAEFFVELFGLPQPKAFYDFLDVDLSNGVTLAFLDAGDMDVQIQHIRESCGGGRGAAACVSSPASIGTRDEPAARPRQPSNTGPRRDCVIRHILPVAAAATLLCTPLTAAAGHRNERPDVLRGPIAETTYDGHLSRRT